VGRGFDRINGIYRTGCTGGPTGGESEVNT